MTRQTKTAKLSKCGNCDVEIRDRTVVYIDGSPICKSCKYQEYSVTQEDIDKVLETPYWPPELKTGKAYSRTHDDCDGDRSQRLVVVFTQDGDAWVEVTQERGHSLRFRNYGGGGMSLRTRSALMLLALAIEKDNQERPQHDD